MLENKEERVLILAPLGQDAPAMAELLNDRGYSSKVCGSAIECCEAMREGAGTLLLTEEALELPRFEDVLNFLTTQPPWSELPLLILTKGGEPRIGRLLDATAAAARSVTLLERPMSVATLHRSVQVALRSRRRQYQVRDLLHEQQVRQDILGKQARLLDLTSDAIIVRDPEDHITYWNKGAEDLYQYSRDEALGKITHDLLRTKFPAERDKILAQLFRRGRWSGELIHTRKDGKEITISSCWALDHDAQGRPVAILEANNDISERRMAEEALMRSEERYRLLVSQVKDYAIFSSDTEGKPVTWNEGVQNVLGFSESEFVGSNLEAIFTDEDRKAGVPKRELATARERGSASNDRWMQRKDGTRFFASGMTTALKDHAGKVIGFTKVLRDVTEKKQAEEVLERAVAERTADLRAANEQLEDFVYSIAHDLRAPLRAMTGFSQLLVQDHAPKLEGMALDMLRRIQSSSEFMDKLLVDLLAYGRAVRADVELGPVPVHEAWEIALIQCAPKIEQSHAKVETIEPLFAVRAHEATLGQVLANLLGNALKFVEPGVTPHVRFWAEEQHSFIRLWMEDNGIGIPEDQRERIFRVFERLHGHLYPGTGIGLSIVRKGIERMNGRVGLESTPGKGSRFWIELPRATA